MAGLKKQKKYEKRNGMLEKEIKFFNKNIDNWINSNNKGKFVLIKDEKAIGFYPKIENAIYQGAFQFGQDFLIKKIKKPLEQEKIPALTKGLFHVNS